MESCCSEIGRGLNANKLKLNEHKTEVLVCGTSCRRKGVPVDTLAVGDACIQFSSTVKFQARDTLQDSTDNSSIDKVETSLE